ncbi:MAG TPA: endonuclease domain-containing protein [Cyclobacteriaceae bacterium]|nr:endonuclease domain-containing protein [Cyclobacteriaceae bacterium]
MKESKDYSHYNSNLRPLANELRKNMTKAEACLWKYVLKARMLMGYQFRRQRPVLNYIADFMCKELSLIIEVDGITHSWEDTVERDKIRQEELERAGYTVLRFEDDEVLQDINGVRQALEDWIHKYELINPPPAPPPAGDSKD